MTGYAYGEGHVGVGGFPTTGCSGETTQFKTWKPFFLFFFLLSFFLFFFLLFLFHSFFHFLPFSFFIFTFRLSGSISDSWYTRGKRQLLLKYRAILVTGRSGTVVWRHRGSVPFGPCSEDHDHFPLASPGTKSVQCQRLGPGQDRWVCCIGPVWFFRRYHLCV